MENTEETRKNNIQYNEPREEQEISISQLLGIVKQRRVWIYVFFVFALGSLYWILLFLVSSVFSIYRNLHQKYPRTVCP